MTGRLEQLFRPRSVVLVGASDKSAWSQLIYSNLRALPFDGEVLAVNRRGASAHGLPGYASCAALPYVPDLAYVFVPAESVAETLEDIAARGIRNVVLLSSGFAEAGHDGAALQREIGALVRRHGLNMLGPNSLGFNNYKDGIAVSAFPVDGKATPGGLAIISQSGATAHVVSQFARMQGIGIGCVVATGNEEVMGLVEVLDHFVDDPAIRSIALFAETIKDPQGFRRAAERASRIGKPIVVLKVGRSELASKLAQAHTGAVTGDDEVFDAVCRHYGVIRVDSLETLVIAAGLLAETGPIEGEIGIISISGGACEIIADRAEEAGLRLAPFSEETQRRLRGVISDFGSVFNPLDVTGAAVRDPSLFHQMLDILSEDPAMGLVAAVQDVPSAEGDTLNVPILTAIGEGLTRSRVPGLLINQALQPISEYSRRVMAECGIPAAIGGVDHAIAAFAALQRWSARPAGEAAREPVLMEGPGTCPASEYQTLNWLEDRGIKVMPHHLVLTAEEAVEAWRAFGGPVVIKIASPDILHKSDIGGVRLNLDDAEAVRAAFDGVMAAAASHHPDAHIEGCIIAPMRQGGTELFVGTARTAWGPVIAVGLGGVWIEILQDSSLRLLPIGPAEARAMIGELKGARLLEGYRGGEPADLDAIAATISAIGDAALALGPDLVSLEINPLRVNGSQVEALDALALWDEGQDPPTGHHDGL